MSKDFWNKTKLIGKNAKTKKESDNHIRSLTITRIPSLGGQMHLSFGHKASNTEITPSRWMDREHQSLEKVWENRFEENYDPKGNYFYFNK